MTTSHTIEPRAHGRGSLLSRGLIALVELYRSWVSPMLMPSCRFDPTCSTYAVQALRTRGALVGTALALVRVLKCAPWHSGGWDPVPPARTKGQQTARNKAPDQPPDKPPDTARYDAPYDEETAGPC